MGLITKIKRLSAEYRKHEKEMKELEVKQATETMKTIVATVTSAVQIAAIARQPIPKNFAGGGVISGENIIVGGNKDASTISVDKDYLKKIISDLKISGKKVN